MAHPHATTAWDYTVNTVEPCTVLSAALARIKHLSYVASNLSGEEKRSSAQLHHESVFERDTSRFSEIPRRFLSGNAGFNPFRVRSHDIFGLALASTRLRALSQGAKLSNFGNAPHTLMVKDIDARAEDLWLESRAILFFKGAYTLATHEGSWCYLCFVVFVPCLG